MRRGVGGTGGNDDSMEYRVGRLKHERVRVTRNPNDNCNRNVLLDRAMVIMRVHADRKSMLEVNA